MDREEYSHIFPTWEIYPRVYFFKNRFVDLHIRFSKVMNALPERFHNNGLMSQLDRLSRDLGGFLKVTVIGKEDMAPGQYIVSTEALEKHTELPGPGRDGIHMCICRAKIRDLGELGKQDISEAANYLSIAFLQRYPDLSNIFIVCETNCDFNGNDADKFRTVLLPTLQKLTEQCRYPIEIVIGPQKVNNLPSIISNALEKQIIDGFCEVVVFLQTFLRRELCSDQENVDILETEIVVKTMQGFLRNGHSLIDSQAVCEHNSFFDLIIRTLCHQIMCAAVSPMAAKHNIPEWVCHGLLEEINVETELQTSITKNTTHHLKKFEEYAENIVKLRAEGKADERTTQSKCFSFDFIVYMLQKDLSGAVASAEKKVAAMSRITIVMRKMIFEVRGYLKQTVVTVVMSETGQRELTLNDITEKLRDDIMGNSCVYGMGTLYGQLEVHLKLHLKEDEIKAAKFNISEILKENRFPHPYIIKTVENVPQQLARDFYEQGDKILSPFPDNYEQVREGTLGCFIKSTDSAIYAVTCAHVVHPHDKNEHEVFIRKPHCPFATSSPLNMIMYGNSETLFLADFAAIKVLPKVLDMCSFRFKDEFGNSKRARLSNESSSELVGSFVFKYGASTGLTKGIIASNSYLFHGQASIEHMVIVEPLPVTSENICSVFASSDSPQSSQGELHTIPVEHAQKDTEEPDLTDLLYVSPNDSRIPSNSNSNGGDETNIAVEYAIGTGKRSSCCTLPRLETGVCLYIRNSETGVVRSPNEVASMAYSDISDTDTHIFAAEGDSGSIVCKTDLLTNEIVAISMITAGNFKLNDPLNSGSESENCLSVRLDKVLAKLTERCETDFVLC